MQANLSSCNAASRVVTTESGRLQLNWKWQMTSIHATFVSGPMDGLARQIPDEKEHHAVDTATGKVTAYRKQIVAPPHGDELGHAVYVLSSLSQDEARAAVNAALSPRGRR